MPGQADSSGRPDLWRHIAEPIHHDRPRRGLRPVGSDGGDDLRAHPRIRIGDGVGDKALCAGVPTSPSIAAVSRRTPGSGSRSVVASARSTSGPPAGVAGPPPPLSTCSARPDLNEAIRLMAYLRRIASTTPVQIAAVAAPSQKICVQAEEALRREQQQARQDDPDLAGYAVVEGQDLGAARRGNHVVHRRPRCVRESALGRHLQPSDEDCGRGAEGHDPQAEPGQVDDRQQQTRRRRPRIARTAGRRPAVTAPARRPSRRSGPVRSPSQTRPRRGMRWTWR